MRALFDVNVLISLLDPDHVGHIVANDWLAANLEHGWASCPMTENGTARVMASGGYPNPIPVALVLERLALAASSGDHQFWADDLSLIDSNVFDRTALFGPKQVSDRYLLGLAVKHAGRLITFDRSIRPTAAVGASEKHVVCLFG